MADMQDPAPRNEPTPADPNKALDAAVAALYFNDSSDFGTALYNVVANLRPDVSQELDDDPDGTIERLYDELNPERESTD